ENNGTFVINSSFPILGEASALIKNNGTFEKSENTETAVVEVPFENAGSARVVSGRLRFTGGGGSRTGAEWVASEGAAFEAWGSGYSFEGGSVTGQLTIGGGVSMTGTTLSGATLVLNSGTLTFPSAESLATLRQTGGALSGTGTLTVTSSLL